MSVYDHGCDPNTLSAALFGKNCNLHWMPPFSPAALSLIRWKWRKVKTQSVPGRPGGLFKAAISAGWHWIPRELSPRGCGTEEALSSEGGGGGAAVEVDDDQYCWVGSACAWSLTFFLFLFWSVVNLWWSSSNMTANYPPSRLAC